ncbi:YibL family ribosome-associated protein [uncultured Shewanella sp.]|uniref:YibL family ribosome-associated protein n=1 Tax=Shewanella atlantica TaxID=271099 RepID=UPI00263764B1|nr:YibL family ribosome-associated protein [uncultured Shewanella sp.]
MNLKEELHGLSDKLEQFRRKLAAAEKRGDKGVMLQFQQEINKVTKRIASVKAQQTRELSKKGGSVASMKFNRVLTKAEQADMGKLKKSVRGLVVVHPMTALGREMGITQVTGFAPKEF